MKRKIYTLIILGVLFSSLYCAAPFSTGGTVEKADTPVTTTTTTVVTASRNHDGHLEALVERKHLENIVLLTEKIEQDNIEKWNAAVAENERIEQARIEEQKRIEQARIEEQKRVAETVPVVEETAPVPVVVEPEPATGRCGGTLPPCWVMQRESGGDIRAQNPTSTASGKWQFINSTWGGYGGYARAKDAPESVQDARARELWAGGAGCSHWSAC